MTEPQPDPGNAPPSDWKGEPYDDADDLDAAAMGQFDDEEPQVRSINYMAVSEFDELIPRSMEDDV